MLIACLGHKTKFDLLEALIDSVFFTSLFSYRVFIPNIISRKIIIISSEKIRITVVSIKLLRKEHQLHHLKQQKYRLIQVQQTISH